MLQQICEILKTIKSQLWPALLWNLVEERRNRAKSSTVVKLWKWFLSEMKPCLLYLLISSDQDRTLSSRYTMSKTRYTSLNILRSVTGLVQWNWMVCDIEEVKGDNLILHKSVKYRLHKARKKKKRLKQDFGGNEHNQFLLFFQNKEDFSLCPSSWISGFSLLIPPSFLT